MKWINKTRSTPPSVITGNLVISPTLQLLHLQLTHMFDSGKTHLVDLTYWFLFERYVIVFLVIDQPFLDFIHGLLTCCFACHVFLLHIFAFNMYDLKNWMLASNVIIHVHTINYLVKKSNELCRYILLNMQMGIWD